MKRGQAYVFFLLLICPDFACAQAGSMQYEIDHLMEYIENSVCIFVRNGKDYSPKVAVQHIKKKYNHYRKKITTTEEFVKLCASKSSMSNKPYKIKCPGRPLLESQDWFLKELARIRKK